MATINRNYKIKNDSDTYDEVHLKTNDGVVMALNSDGNLTTETVHEVLLRKADKIGTDKVGYLAKFNDQGNPVASSKTESDFVAAETNISTLTTDINSTDPSSPGLKMRATILENTKQKKVAKGTLSMPTASWSAVSGQEEVYYQNVTITNGTRYTMVNLQPDYAAIKQMIEDGTNAIYVVNDEQETPTFTAYAIGEKPTVNLTVQTSLTEIN